VSKDNYHVTVGDIDMGPILGFKVKPVSSGRLKVQLEVFCTYEAMAQFTRFFADWSASRPIPAIPGDDQ
jgi:hypothetical protein